MTTSTNQHRELARGQSATSGVLTVSDTRTESDDQSGQTIIKALEGAGHAVKAYAIVKDEPDQIGTELRRWLQRGDLDLICTTGGTGISSRDTTIEVVRGLLDKELEGFGQLFRMLSWDEVGPAAMLSRTVAGLAGQTLVFALPGSSNAVSLALNRLIVPELPHLVWERQR